MIQVGSVPRYRMSSSSLTLASFFLIWLSHLPTILSQAGNFDAKLYLFPSTIIQKYNAVCLDGSPPGLYYRPASNPGSNTKWKIHISGGGWCTGLSDCYARSKTLLGSSNYFTPWLSALWPPEFAGFYGLMDNNATNPFGDWNFVWFAYCDGTSQTSDNDNILYYNNTPLYFRGRAILDGHLDLLEQINNFLTKSTEVIVSGTSAGSLATYFHTGYIKSRIVASSSIARSGKSQRFDHHPSSSIVVPNTRVVAMPDAGFFLDVAYYNTNNDHVWYNQVANAITSNLWNATLQGNAHQCIIDKNSSGTVAQCFFIQYLYPYLIDNDGIFIMQSTYDTANLGICYGMNCNLYTSCNSTEIQAIQNYHELLETSVQTAQNYFSSRDSSFMTSCYQHEESCRARDWYGIIINNQNANTTFYNWYTYGNGDNATRLDVPWPGDTSCAPQGFDHGAC